MSAYSKIALALVLANALIAPVGQTAFAQNSEASEKTNWIAKGGELSISFNTELLRELGITLSADRSAPAYELTTIPLALSDAAALAFVAPQGSLEHFLGGQLQAAGRFEWHFAGKRKSFEGFHVRPRAGTERDLELLDAEGKVWFVNDHVHFELVENQSILSMRNMDLRLAPAAAAFLGDSTLTGLSVGTMEFKASVVQRAPIELPQSCAAPNWPGKLLDPQQPSGGTYQADVLLGALNSLDYKRCQGVCDGPGGASDGRAVFAPNAFLRNSDTNTTADVPWYAKFTGNFAPYNTDQHPFLTWNVYRIRNDTGQIEHIGRSGVKHAFLTLNNDCAQYNCNDNHILWRRCTDIYSSSNNDSSPALGPRSEIVPAKGIWARCGSIYDVNCDGSQDSITQTNFDHRLLVRESDISDTTNYRYYYEGWYIVRDDVNIYNTMGFREFTPSYNSIWQSLFEQAFVNGPVIDLWVNPSNPGSGNLSTEIVHENGRLKLAVRTRLLPNGNTRYDYALMNFDFVNAQLSTQPAGVRMDSRAGISALALPDLSTTLSNIAMVDGDSAKADWLISQKQGLRFSAPNSSSELEWANLIRFSFEASTTPVAGTLQLEVPGSAIPISVQSLVPAREFNGFANGFE